MPVRPAVLLSRFSKKSGLVPCSVTTFSVSHEVRMFLIPTITFQTLRSVTGKDTESDLTIKNHFTYVLFWTQKL